MALLEINLEKPALVEEYQYPGETSRESEGVAATESAGGGRGRLVAILALVVGVGLLAWRLRSGGSEQADLGDFDAEEREAGPEPEIGGEESGSRGSKVAGLLGLAVAVAGLGAVVRKRRD